MSILSFKAIDLSDDDFTNCYKMVLKLKPFYISSGFGWNSRFKKDEMRNTPNMEFLIIKEGEGAGEGAGKGDKIQVQAFASFVLDDHLNEDGTGEEISYLYELHVQQKSRGKGYGRMLIERIKQMSRGLPIVLTVCDDNKTARDFYRYLGFKRVEKEEEEEEEEEEGGEEEGEEQQQQQQQTPPPPPPPPLPLKRKLNKSTSNKSKKSKTGYHQLRLDWTQ